MTEKTKISLTEQKERLLDKFHSHKAFVRLCKVAGVYRGPESQEEMKGLIIQEIMWEYHQRLSRLREEAALDRGLQPHPSTLADGEARGFGLSGEIAFAEAVASASETEVVKGIDTAQVQVETEMAYPVVNTLGQVVGYVDIAGRIKARGSWNPVRFLELADFGNGTRRLGEASPGMRRVWEDEVKAAVWVQVEIPSFYEFLKHLKGYLHYLNWHQEIPYRAIVVSPDNRHRERFAREKISFVTPEEASLE